MCKPKVSCKIVKVWLYKSENIFLGGILPIQKYFAFSYEKVEVGRCYTSPVLHGSSFDFPPLPSFLSADSGINGVRVCLAREEGVATLTNNHWYAFLVLRVKPHYLRSVIFKRYWVFHTYNPNVKVDVHGTLEIRFLLLS